MTLHMPYYMNLTLKEAASNFRQEPNSEEGSLSPPAALNTVYVIEPNNNTKNCQMWIFQRNLSN